MGEGFFTAQTAGAALDIMEGSVYYIDNSFKI